MQDLNDLNLVLRSSVPIILVETQQEPTVVQLFRKLAGKRREDLYKWSITEGLERVVGAAGLGPPSRRPEEVLTQIKSTRNPAIFLLTDFHPYLDEPVNVRLLKDVALAREKTGITVALISHSLAVPAEIEGFCARFSLSMPTRNDLARMVTKEVRRFASANPGKRVTGEPAMAEQLVENLLGLTLNNARRLVRGAIEDDGVLTESDLPEIMKAKFRLLGQDGVLSFEYDTARFGDVGGLTKLKEWLALRRDVFLGQNEQVGLDNPKGIMLLGVQGCGKSLAAKAVAGAWGVPLMRLDFGSLYNKYHGETERNLRESLKTAAVMAPCVLWADEIEKGISTGQSDGGLSKRVLGTLLTWMAENDDRVFIVATANDIESLPPELLRKGRLDEIFFVDLPDADVRRIILEIHLRKRDQDPQEFELDDVVTASQGFSGSELEQVVVAALYATYARNAELTVDDLLHEVNATKPLSVVMAERIAHLRAWAAERTVPAN